MSAQRLLPLVEAVAEQLRAAGIDAVAGKLIGHSGG
jgi:hypothetical protein